MKYRNTGFLELILIFCCIFLFSQSPAHGQQGKAYLEMKGPAPNVLIEINVLKNGINSGYIGEVDTYEWQPEINRCLEIPMEDSLSYARILVFDKTNINTVHKSFSNFFYLLERGDSIQIEDLSGDIHFKGRGSEKWNCIDQVYRHEDIGSRHITNKLIKEGRYRDALLADKSKLDSLLAVQQLVLRQFQPKLSKHVHDLIFVDLLAGHYKKWNFILSSKSRDFAFVKAKRDLWKEYWAKFEFPVDNQDLLTQSYLYADFLYERAVFGLKLLANSENGEPRRRRSSDLLTVVNQVPKGILRDKLYLITIYQNLNSRASNIHEIDSLIKNMGANRYRQQIEVLRRNKKGNPAFDFNLPDQYGNRHRLSDYRGKLLVVDFWFTGCHACRNLYEGFLKQIVTKYKNEEDVVFMSVNVDKKKEWWLKSVKEGIYCSPDEINLYTEGLGRYHDIIKYHFIIGFPTVVIISKDGQIITTSPPRPQNNTDIPKAKNAFIELIEANR